MNRTATIGGECHDGRQPLRVGALRPRRFRMSAERFWTWVLIVFVVVMIAVAMAIPAYLMILHHFDPKVVDELYEMMREVPRPAAPR